MRTAQHHHSGFSIIEVMVTIFILTVGLLGLAGLQLRAINSEADAYARGQAVMLMDQMAETIVARKSAAMTGGYEELQGGDPRPYGFGDTRDCTGMADGAIRDLCRWSEDLTAGTRTGGGGTIGVLDGPIGCVAWDLPNRTYTVSVTWISRDATPAGIQPTIACDVTGIPEARRRSVLRGVRLATLDAL